jgi:hypothetical protein
VSGSESNKLDSKGVVLDASAQVTIDQPHERAAYRARLDNAHPIAACDADDRQGTEDGITEKAINQN